MPAWKKLITSGSDASLTSLTVTNGVTGSLFGTASYATQALSASWAPSAGGSITIGSTAISLGSSATTIAGLTSVTSTGFTGALTGNASTATTAGAWTTGRTITIGSTGKTVDGSGNVSWTLTEIGAYANTNPSGYTTNTGTVTSVATTGTVSGITLTGGTITGAGTITLGGSISGLTNSNLSGTAGITNANLANSSVTVGSTAISLGSSATTIAGLSSVTSTTFVGALTGNASTATSATSATTATTATNATNIAITDTTTTAGTYYPVFVSATTGNVPARTDSSTFTYNPNTNTLTVGTVSGNLSGNASTATVAGKTLQENTGGTGTFYMMMTPTAVGGDGRTYNTSNQGDPISYNAATATLTSKYFVGALTGNASTATSAATLTTARTLTIGSTGKTFNGSANVAWSLAEIGAQAALTNPVTGTGTTNYLSKFTGTSTIGNSQIFDNGTNVGIGTASPSFPLSFGTGLGNKIALYDAGSGTGYGFGIQSSLLQIFSNAVGDDITFGYGNSASLTRNVTFKGAGNVGIGTTSPDSRLSVGLRASVDGNVRLSAAGAGADSGASLLWDMTVGGGFATSHLAEIRPESYATGVNKNILNFYVGGWNNNATSGTSKMTITEDGRLGIATINPGHVLDVNGSGNATYDFRAPIFYDTDNTAYYVNPHSVSKLYQVDASSTINASVNVTAGANITATGYMYATSYIQSAASMYSPIYYEGSNSAYYFDGGNTGDSIRTAGNIVAYYSDERLKDNKGNIENALEKLLTLNGFYYEPNERAQELGYKKKLEIGVSAQEVEAILPEIVNDAPIGYGYKTLDYSKLVPLLIEAIKEQQKQIDELKSIK